MAKSTKPFRYFDSVARGGRDQRAELDHPAANRLGADVDATLGRQFLNISNAQREPEIEPHRMEDHTGGNRRRLNEMGTMPSPPLPTVGP